MKRESQPKHPDEPRDRRPDPVRAWVPGGPRAYGPKARSRVAGDERGAVYVEFLIAFFPLFLMFLAICQLALLGAAEAIVRHAAYAGVRSAIVVIDDDERHFDHAPRGDLSAGDPYQMKNDLVSVATKLGLGVAKSVSRAKSSSPARPTVLPRNIVSSVQLAISSLGNGEGSRASGEQQGARMAPIRAAAQLPLVPLAPNQSTLHPGQETVYASLASPEQRQLQYAFEYTMAASVVTVHAAPDTDALITEPIAPNASVTVKVEYAFQCNVPWVRTLMCRPLARLLETHYGTLIDAQGLTKIVNPESRFKLLTACATLPNQGANYATPKERK